MAATIADARDLRIPDRRRAVRYPVRIPVRILTCGADVSGVQGHTADVSSCGFRVVTDVDLGDSAEQTVMIETAGGPIVARVDVARRERRGSQWVCGLVVTDITDTDQLHLERLCLEGA